MHLPRELSHNRQKNNVMRSASPINLKCANGLVLISIIQKKNVFFMQIMLNALSMSHILFIDIYFSFIYLSFIKLVTNSNISNWKLLEIDNEKVEMRGHQLLLIFNNTWLLIWARREMSQESPFKDDQITMNFYQSSA